MIATKREVVIAAVGGMVVGILLFKLAQKIDRGRYEVCIDRVRQNQPLMGDVGNLQVEARCFPPSIMGDILYK